MISSLILLTAVVAPASDPANVPIPESIRAMLDAALASGNEGDIATIVKYARAADPLSGDAVLAIADQWRRARDDQRTEHIRQANFLDLWSGKAELGGFLTTGTSDTAGLTGALSATREGIRWRQKFHGQIDY